MLFSIKKFADEETEDGFFVFALNTKSLRFFSLGIRPGKGVVRYVV